MNTMINRPRKLALLAIVAAGLMPAAAAHAHWNCRSCAGPAPLYPYHHRHYYRYVEAHPLAVQLAPNVFAIPYRLRAFPYVRCLDGCGSHVQWQRGYGEEAPVTIETEESGAPLESGKQRVIRAEAEVTIIGPDRMNIRLFRKERGTTIERGD
jgi:hypothetical protein